MATEKNALVVDDEEVNRRVIGRILTRLGYNVTEAMSGAEAVNLSNEQNFDLITMDNNMESSNAGIEAIKSIRLNNEEVFIICVSTVVYNMRKVFHGEPNIAFLSKPVSSHDIEMILNELSLQELDPLGCAS